VLSPKPAVFLNLPGRLPFSVQIPWPHRKHHGFHLFFLTTSFLAPANLFLQLLYPFWQVLPLYRLGIQYFWAFLIYLSFLLPSHLGQYRTLCFGQQVRSHEMTRSSFFSLLRRVRTVPATEVGTTPRGEQECQNQGKTPNSPAS
jgi:hypothetical protein